MSSRLDCCSVVLFIGNNGGFKVFYDFCGVSAKNYYGVTDVLMFQYFWLSFVAYLLIQATVSSRLDCCSVVLFMGNNGGFKVFL